MNDKVNLLGGIGQKKSNNGTQLYEQDRIYDSKGLATAIPTSFQPNYAEGGYMNNLRIRKLTPNETMRLMAFEKKDTESMRKIGMSDSQIYHCSGDSIVVNCLIGIFGEMLGVDTEKIMQDYAERLANE